MVTADGAGQTPADPADAAAADPAGAAAEGVAPELRRRLAALLGERQPRRVEEAAADRRAAVALVLRPGAAPDDLRSLETLVVLRAERETDPWSGHVGLPGGHREPGDADLAAAALRELSEETGLSLPRSAILGRLDEILPRGARLPSVAVTPFPVWHAGGGTVEAGPEVAGHLWTPLRTFEDPDRRSVLTFRRGGALRAFPAVEVDGLTVWGLTYAILRRFLSLLPDGGAGGDDARGGGDRAAQPRGREGDAGR